MPSALVPFQDEVTQWGMDTFPGSTSEGILKHLATEHTELAVAVGEFEVAEYFVDTQLTYIKREKVAEEAADCLILLLRLAGRFGFDLQGEAIKKMDVNRRREWSARSNHRAEAKVKP